MNLIDLQIEKLQLATQYNPFLFLNSITTYL